jgi:hypothetical protein
VVSFTAEEETDQKMYSKLKIVTNQILYKLGFVIDTTVSPNEIQKVLSLLDVIELNIPFKRIGSRFDGGYVVPDVLENISNCLSFGVSDNCELESQMANQGMKVFAIDGSIHSFPTPNKNIKFTQKYVGRSTSENYVDVNKWVIEHVRLHENMMFAMDIEESEWEVILELEKEILDRVDIFIVEFHGFHQLSQKSFLRKASSALIKLSETHTVVNTNLNNTAPTVKFSYLKKVPTVIEVTYISNRMIREYGIKEGLEYQKSRQNLNQLNNPDRATSI